MDSDVLTPEFRKADNPFEMELHAFNCIHGLLTHACVAYWLLYLLPFGYVPLGAIIFAFIYGYLSRIGVSVGCHRYWTHRSFKANRPLQIILMVMQTASFQHSIFKWSRDHRAHHKFLDSNADPYSANRGFWFSHMIWLIYPRHPDFVKSLKTIEISDLVNDPIAADILQILLGTCSCHVLQYPDVNVPYSFPGNVVVRYGMSLQVSFLVNSAAHKLGDKAYDKYITPTNNKWVSILTIGDGWHNYHHAFPWDYKSVKLGSNFELGTAFIHFFAMIGWAWDLKTVSHKLLRNRINRTGDGSHPLHNHDMENDKQASVRCWGWGDENLRKEDVEITKTLFPDISRQG